MTGQTGEPSSPLRYDNVLVPLDGSDDATAALGTARALAARFGATLHTISLAPTSDQLPTLRSRTAADLEVPIDDQHVHTAVSDVPAVAINTLAAQLDRCLICMTTKGHGRVAGALIGSTARSVIHEHRRPILVVGPLAGRRHYFDSAPSEPLIENRVVACVNGTTTSDPAVTVAAQWAQSLDMPLTILTIQTPTISTTDTTTAAVLRVLQQLADGVAQHPIEIDTHIHPGPIGVADGVTSHLTRHPAAIVVVSTRALSGVRRLTGGATAANIAAAVDVATLMVPAD